MLKRETRRNSPAGPSLLSTPPAPPLNKRHLLLKRATWRNSFAGPYLPSSVRWCDRNIKNKYTLRVHFRKGLKKSQISRSARGKQNQKQEEEKKTTSHLSFQWAGRRAGRRADRKVGRKVGGAHLPLLSSLRRCTVRGCKLISKHMGTVGNWDFFVQTENSNKTTYQAQNTLQSIIQNTLQNKLQNKLQSKIEQKSKVA